MINKVIKKNILLVILSFVAFIMLAMGASYALFFQYNENTTNQVISVGNVDASLSSSTGVLSITDLSPKNYSDLEPNENTYSFTVSNTGSYTLQYEVYLTNNTESFIQECQINGCQGFSENPLESTYFQYIKYHLDGVTNTLSDISRTGKKIIGTGIILSGEAKTYTMQLWLDSSAPNNIIGKTASFNIKVNAVAIDTPIESSKDEVSLGDIVKIGTEEFYVLSSDDGTTRMLSRYNIRVGDDVTSNSLTSIQEDDELYNKQDPDSVGPYTPTTDYFSYRSVIKYTDLEHYEGQGACGENTCYNNYQGSNLQDKINSYANYLRSKYGADVVGDAPTIDDYNLLTQIPNHYKTSFWTKSTDGQNNTNVYSIRYDSDLELTNTNARTDYGGVRPIISVSSKNIRKKLYLDNTTILVDEETLEDNRLVIGSVVSIGDELFYVISHNNGVVRLLAKEVLNCDAQEENTIQAVNIDNYDNMPPFTNDERKELQGICENSNIYSPYCFSGYKHSLAEDCANRYKETIYRLYQTSVRVDLPTFADLIALDYSELTKQFKYAGYSWAYSANYWTKEAKSNTTLYAVNSSNNVVEVEYNSKNYGVRPIVIIHDSQIANLT